MMALIDKIKADREAGTSPDCGNWNWYGGRDDLYLATERRGRQYVMGFRRKGMRSAQPTFQIAGVMHGAIDDLTTYAVGDGTARGQKQADADPTVYRISVSGVDHPDARRIARVPDLEAIALAANELLNDLDGLIAESDGVAGLHQNGDLAPWDELVSGGRFEEWIASLEKLRTAFTQGLR